MRKGIIRKEVKGEAAIQAEEVIPRLVDITIIAITTVEVAPVDIATSRTIARHIFSLFIPFFILLISAC